MGKSPVAPTFSEAIVLSVQLLQEVSRAGVKWTVDINRPGRQGHFARSWSNVDGTITADQLSDLSVWVAKTFNNAVVAWGGVQGVIDT